MASTALQHRRRTALAAKPSTPAAATKALPADPDLHDFSAMLLALHEGAIEPKRWEDFLARIARRLSASASTLILHSPTSGQISFASLVGGVPGGQEAYVERYFALDPFVHLPPGKVMTLHDVVSKEQLEDSRFFKEYLVPMDTPYNMGVDLHEHGRFYAKWRVCRPAASNNFTAEERRFCELLVPHLSAALHTHAELDLMRSERAFYADAMDHLTMASILLDESGKVLHMNKMAVQILAEKDGISLVGDALSLAQRDDAKQFRAAMGRMADVQQRSEPGLVEIMRIRRPSGRPDIGMIIRPAPPALAEHESHTLSAVAVYLSVESQDEDLSVAAVQKLFNLTPKEAALALQLTTGKTLQEASEALNISLNTSRAHLRAIFAKTGIDRQAKLVRAILKSVAMLGH